VGCLALRICENVHSTWRFSCLTVEEPYFGTLIVESDMCTLGLRDVRRARCSGVILCIAHLRNVHSTRRFSCLTLEEPYFGKLNVETGTYLVLEDTSRAGCSVGMPRIAYSRSWTLDAAIFMPHFGRALLWCAHRR
jgi:hypothetical protein